MVVSKLDHPLGRKKGSRRSGCSLNFVFVSENSFSTVEPVQIRRIDARGSPCNFFSTPGKEKFPGGVLAKGNERTNGLLSAGKQAEHAEEERQMLILPGTFNDAPKSPCPGRSLS